jgi:nitroreductase
MNVKDAIEKRRAYRSLDPCEIKESLINDLAKSAQLFASCFNNQPWRYIFVYEKEMLQRMHEALSQGNDWAKDASMIIVVFCKKDDDCIIRDREYFLFDTGMATAAMILRATELGLVAHPIAGFSPKKTREILQIPDEYQIIALVIVGKHADTIKPVLSQKQVEAEKQRPQRLPLNQFIYLNTYEG